MTDLVKIQNNLEAIDVTQLVKFTNKIKEIGHGFNPMLAPIYLQDFIIAYDISNTMLASAVKADLMAENACKQAESIAFLDRASSYIKESGLKDSAEARKKYIDIDSDVIAAKELRAKTTAIVTFLKNKLQAFRMAHDDIKKMAYTDQYQTDNESS